MAKDDPIPEKKVVKFRGRLHKVAKHNRVVDKLHLIPLRRRGEDLVPYGRGKMYPRAIVEENTEPDKPAE